MLIGEPGIGKSELALTLLHKNHRLIADDAPHFYLNEGKIYGCSSIEKPLLSVRGIGLVDVEKLVGPFSYQASHPLHLIIELRNGQSPHAISHLIGEQTTKDLLGCLIPCVTIPIITPRNLEILVEIIVKKYLISSSLFPNMEKISS